VNKGEMLNCGDDGMRYRANEISEVAKFPIVPFNATSISSSHKSSYLRESVGLKAEMYSL
jgi:hypothetical protein